MFHEYRDLISELKTRDLHFTKLFNAHNALDHQIEQMEKHLLPGTPAEIEHLKKEKLHLKDQIYAQLKKAGAS